MFDPWVWKIPWRRKWQPIPVFLPGESHGQRRLAGHSPWGQKESDMTEHAHTYTCKHLHMHTHTHTHTTQCIVIRSFLHARHRARGWDAVNIVVTQKRWGHKSKAEGWQRHMGATRPQASPHSLGGKSSGGEGGGSTHSQQSLGVWKSGHQMLEMKQVTNETVTKKA